jgi:hypothetical protein
MNQSVTDAGMRLNKPALRRVGNECLWSWLIATLPPMSFDRSTLKAGGQFPT